MVVLPSPSPQHTSPCICFSAPEVPGEGGKHESLGNCILLETQQATQAELTRQLKGLLRLGTDSYPNTGCFLEKTSIRVMGRAARAEGMEELSLHVWQRLCTHQSSNTEKKPLEVNEMHVICLSICLVKHHSISDSGKA